MTEFRKGLECINHFQIATAALKMGGGVMEVYGFSECAAVYVTIPVESRTFECNLPLSHLVKLLRNPGSSDHVHLGFGYDHLRVTCGVMHHDVKYVQKPIPPVKYPTVKPAARYELKLPVLKQFLRMASDEVSLHQSHGLCLKTTHDGMVESSVHFPTYNDPLITLFNIPLLCTEPNGANRPCSLHLWPTALLWSPLHTHQHLLVKQMRTFTLSRHPVKTRWLTQTTKTPWLVKEWTLLS